MNIFISIINGILVLIVMIMLMISFITILILIGEMIENYWKHKRKYRRFLKGELSEDDWMNEIKEYKYYLKWRQKYKK